MTLLTRKSHDESMLEGLLSMKTEDLQLVMEDGVLKTSKFLLMNIFPQLSDYVPGYIISYHKVTIHLPGHTMNTVREALVKMFTIGDATDLAGVLGFEVADVGEHVETVVSEDIERMDIVDVKPVIKEEELSCSESPNAAINIQEAKSELSENIRIPICKEDVSAGEKKIRDFKCPLCPMAFRSRSNVTIHMVGAQEKNGNFKCPHCSFAFKTQSNVSRHIEVAHGLLCPVPIKCKTCDSVFDRDLGYRNHRKNCSYYRCAQCSRTFGTRRNLDRHIPKAHHQKVICERCKTEFDGRYSYNNHTKGCFFRCDRCEYFHKVESKMEVHKRTHITEDRKAKEFTERIVVVYK